MIAEEQIKSTIHQLFQDSKNDHFVMMKSMALGILRPLQPSDFKNVYLSISAEQGQYLKQLIIENDIKNIVEFGTSFGISTLYLAQGVAKTNGNIITTELVESKAAKAKQNFQQAGVLDLIDVRTGDAMETLKNHDHPIDLLLLDGWKDLYLPLFQMLEPNFHSKTFIYVDNADMADTQQFLKVVSQNSKYQLQTQYHGKVVLITLKK